MRETYLKFLDELKTNNFDEEKEILLKIDEKYTKLYNFVIEYPKQLTYKAYVDESYKIYESIENYTKQLEDFNN